MSNKDNQKPVTSQMIADIAGVSRATVGRVLRNEPYVKSSTRKRVEDAIKKYNYKPNTAGVALVSNRSNIKIGVISFAAVDGLYAELNQGSTEAMQDYQNYGISIAFRYIDDPENEESIVSAIKELMSEGIKGLAIMGIDVPSVRQALQEIENNIPIVTYNTEISDVDVLCFVGQDSIRSGRTAGALVRGLVKDGGKVIAVVNSMMVSAVSRRVDGFKQVLTENPGLELVATLENQSSNQRSYEIVKDVLKREPNINSVYIACGFGSAGVCKALRECGKDDVHVVAHDMLPYTVDLIRQGQIDFSIDQELFRQGYQSVEILAKYLLFKTKPDTKNVFTKIDIKMKENI